MNNGNIAGFFVIRQWVFTAGQAAQAQGQVSKKQKAAKSGIIETWEKKRNLEKRQP